MKSNLVILLLFTSTFSLFSQENTEKPKVREIGLNFFNFQSYGFQYKVGNGESMWRFRAINGGISFNDHQNQDPSIPVIRRTNRSMDVNIGASVGREKRKEIMTDFQFVYGIELLTNYQYRQTSDGMETRKTQGIGAGIGGVIGMRYDITDRFYAGAELLPSLMYNFRNNTSSVSTNFPSQTSSFNLGFNANSALLSFGIKF